MDGAITHIQLACFSLGETLFAVDIMRIREILLPPKLSPLPGGSDYLDGVINLRGSVIPVMNMRKRLGMQVTDNVPVGKLLIVSLVGQLLALIVDDVMEVITVAAADIHPPIQLSPGVSLAFVVGVCLSQSRVFLILDIDALPGTECTVQTAIPHSMRTGLSQE
jgi:purine-binding chemotaxis protein CheW